MSNKEKLEQIIYLFQEYLKFNMDKNIAQVSVFNFLPFFYKTTPVVSEKYQMEDLLSQKKLKFSHYLKMMDLVW